MSETGLSPPHFIVGFRRWEWFPIETTTRKLTHDLILVGFHVSWGMHLFSRVSVASWHLVVIVTSSTQGWSCMRVVICGRHSKASRCTFFKVREAAKLTLSGFPALVRAYVIVIAPLRIFCGVRSSVGTGLPDPFFFPVE